MCTKNNITMIRNKEHYSPPRVKVVSFCVEEGFLPSMASFDTGLLERLSQGSSYDGSIFGTVIGGSTAIGGGAESLGNGSTYGGGFWGSGDGGGGGGSTENLGNGSTYGGGFF